MIKQDKYTRAIYVFTVIATGLLLGLLIALVDVSAQIQQPQPRVIYKDIPTQATRITTSTYDTLQLSALVNMNELTFSPMMIDIGILAKTDPALDAILRKYVVEIDDANGNKVWP